VAPPTSAFAFFPLPQVPLYKKAGNVRKKGGNIYRQAYFFYIHGNWAALERGRALCVLCKIFALCCEWRLVRGGVICVAHVQTTCVSEICHRICRVRAFAGMNVVVCVCVHVCDHTVASRPLSRGLEATEQWPRGH